MGRGEEEMGGDREGVGKGGMAMGRGWRRYGWQWGGDGERRDWEGEGEMREYRGDEL